MQMHFHLCILKAARCPAELDVLVVSVRLSLYYKNTSNSFHVEGWNRHTWSYNNTEEVKNMCASILEYL